MHRPSRLIALLSSLFLVGLVVVTSGFACDKPGTTDVTMSGMNMNVSHTAALVNATAPSAPELPAPCKFPWAPDGCQSMIPCSPAAVASTATRVEMAVRPGSNRIAMVALAPPSETPAPELPPPRA